MKHSSTLLIVACSLLLGSCGKASEPTSDEALEPQLEFGETPEPQLEAACNQLLAGDQKASIMLESISATITEFCSCYASTQISRDGTENYAWVKHVVTVMELVIDERAEGGGAADEAIHRLKLEIVASESRPAVTVYDLDQVGESFRKVTNAYEQGQCTG